MLYKALPTDVQIAFTEFFTKEQLKVRGDMPIIRRMSPLPSEDAEYDPWALEILLADFLEVHNEGFTEWRYHFQPELQKTIYADFALMAVFYTAMQKVIKKYTA